MVLLGGLTALGVYEFGCTEEKKIIMSDSEWIFVTAEIFMGICMRVLSVAKREMGDAGDARK